VTGAGGPQPERYVGIRWAGAPVSLLFERVGTAAGGVRLAPSVPGDPMPPAGTEVDCELSTGGFRGRVRDSDGATIVVACPPWVLRPAQRASLRVETDIPVEVEHPGGRWSGRLVDLSVGGAAIVVERSLPLATGASIPVVLPAGRATATIRARRHHEHPLLVVLGVSWQQRDDAAQRWVLGEVASRRRRREPRGA
jgi:hypothetical protein